MKMTTVVTPKVTRDSVFSVTKWRNDDATIDPWRAGRTV